MDNLHLKNIIQKPNGLVILKKLSNPNYPYHKNTPYEYSPYEYIPKELIKEIIDYINSLTFKNRNFKDFISDYKINLKNNKVRETLTVTKQIITLLAKYKLNKLDINNNFNFEKINNDIKSHPDQTILNNKIEIIYTAPSGLRIGLEINSNDKQNKISEISCIAY